MNYFIDCEFDGFGGPLLSMALVREDGESRYWILPYGRLTPWVADNVAPHLRLMGQEWADVQPEDLPGEIHGFLRYDPKPHIIADWPDDIKYFCQALITGPGTMVAIPGFTTQVVRVDAYPTTLAGAVQHNALWDALALKEALIPA